MLLLLMQADIAWMHTCFENLPQRFIREAGIPPAWVVAASVSYLQKASKKLGQPLFILGCSFFS